MDDFDRKLLKLVQIDNRQTAEQLSEKIGLSPTACQKRLKRLRGDGTIAADISVLSREKTGQHVLIITHVTLEKERLDLLADFKKKMLSAPEVMQCYYVTGKADFIVILSAKDMKEYEDFTHHYFFQNPNVNRFESNIVMDEVKVSLSIPLNNPVLV